MGLSPVPMKDVKGQSILKVDYKHRTLLNLEMHICATYLHCPHEVFSSFSREEKMKWYAFEEMERKREKFFSEEAIAEAKAK